MTASTPAPPPSQAEPAPRSAGTRRLVPDEAAFRFSEALGTARRQPASAAAASVRETRDHDRGHLAVQEKDEGSSLAGDAAATGDAIEAVGARQEREPGAHANLNSAPQAIAATMGDAATGSQSAGSLAEFGAMIDRLYIGAGGEAGEADGPDQLMLRFNQAIAPLAGIRLARTDSGTMHLVIAAHAGDRVQLQAGAQRLRDRLIARGHRIEGIEFEADPDPAARLGRGNGPA